MSREYNVRAGEILGHGDGKIVASYFDNNGKHNIDILFPNSQLLKQRKYPVATFDIKIIENGIIISIEPEITNKDLNVKLVEIAESGLMPPYSEIISQEPPLKTAEGLKPSISIFAITRNNGKDCYRSHCFKCGCDIDAKINKQCKICKKYKCSVCGACHCEYNGI